MSPKDLSFFPNKYWKEEKNNVKPFPLEICHVWEGKYNYFNLEFTVNILFYTPLDGQPRIVSFRIFDVSCSIYVSQWRELLCCTVDIELGGQSKERKTRTIEIIFNLFSNFPKVIPYFLFSFGMGFNDVWIRIVERVWKGLAKVMVSIHAWWCMKGNFWRRHVSW